jgi:hypothetical protein
MGRAAASYSDGSSPVIIKPEGRPDPTSALREARQISLMSIQDWAAIGEIVSAVAVVISVLYLAAQVRQATLIARREAFESTVSRILHNWLDDVAENEDAARVYHEGLQDYEGLSAVQKIRFRSLMLKLLIAHEPAIDAIRTQPGLMKITAIDAMHHNLLHHLTSNGGRQWWDEDGKNWPAADYRQYLDELIASIE